MTETITAMPEDARRAYLTVLGKLNMDVDAQVDKLRLLQALSATANITEAIMNNKEHNRRICSGLWEILHEVITTYDKFYAEIDELADGKDKETPTDESQ